MRIFWIEVMVKGMVLELYMGFVETFLWINFKVSSRKEENVTLSKIGLILRQNNHKEMKILKIIFFHTSSTIVLRLNIGHVKTNLLQRQILSQFAINTFISDQHNPQFLQSLRRRANARNVSFFYPLRWLIYVFNSVVNTKLPSILSHWRSTTVSLETYHFIFDQSTF